MIELTQNDWVQRDIINKIKISAKRGSDTIHAIIMTKYQKCPSTTILKHENVLSKLNELNCGRSQNMTLHDAYSIPIHVSTMNPSDIIHKQKE